MRNILLIGVAFVFSLLLLSIIWGSSVQRSNTLGAVDIDAVTISVAARTVDIGSKDYQVSKFKIYETGGKDDVNITMLRFYNNGDANEGDLVNLKLGNDNDGTVLATVAKIEGKYVTFNLSPALKISKGQNKTVVIAVDVVNGPTKTSQFIIKNDYDVTATGVSTGADLLATHAINLAGDTNAGFPIGDNPNYNTIVVSGNKPYQVHDVEPAVALDASSPGASGIVAGSVRQVVAVFNVAASNDGVASLKGITLARAGNIGTRLAVSAKPKVYDYSSGSLGTLLGTGTNWSGVTTGSVSSVTFDTPYSVTAGQVLKLAVTVDTSAAIANDTFQVYLPDTYNFVSGNTLRY
ncbi:MAG: hypothetical protein HYR95_00165 [Candidatus Colwellbacteria bacterium]|nr:hypothetical protein [Candidatus Colwellbacteria bacterium]